MCPYYNFSSTGSFWRLGGILIPAQTPEALPGKEEGPEQGARSLPKTNCPFIKSSRDFKLKDEGLFLMEKFAFLNLPLHRKDLKLCLFVCFQIKERQDKFIWNLGNAEDEDSGR